MGNISPLSPIPVSYTASIPGDTTLYYIRAVIKDTQSSTTLQTINLSRVSSTPNRYTGLFNSVSDPSGMGRPVDITISVYTDSGYTTLSPNYNILQLNYVVLQPWLPTLGSGGGLNIDYEKLQKMFDGTKVGNEEYINEKLSKLPKVDYEAIMASHKSALQETSREMVATIKNDLQNLLLSVETSKADLTRSHTSGINALHMRLNSLESVVTTGNTQSKQNGEMSKKELNRAILETREELKNMHAKHSKNMEEHFKKTTGSIQDYLGENLGGKELHLNVPALSFTPSNKREKVEDPNEWTPEKVQRLYS